MKAGSKTIELVCITIAEHACVTRVNDPQFVLHRL
jgi:hypothetical protein